MQLYQGVVENRLDPLKLGRCQVRVVGIHTHDKSRLPTDDLPWAYPMQPVTSAAMSGIGHSPVGPVEGTWVVVMFRDDDMQYPVMLGTIGGIPQTPTPVDQDAPGILLKSDPTGTTPSADPTVPSDVVGSNTNEQVPVATQAGATGATTVTTDIPTDPPPEFKTLRDQRKKSIQALLAACDKFGITSREVKCSILAMAGGESGYIPADEGYSYSETSLKSVFYTTFTKKHPEKAAEYARWKGSREDFFNFVYAPENNGSGLGNTQPGDGGKYYGRGLTGITGRYAYGYYGNKIGVDLLANPGLLSSDLSVSAQASAMMIWDNTKKKFKNVSETANPDYFYAAKRAQGKDANEEGAARRLRYYEYFYGNKVPSSFTEDKSAAPAGPSSDSSASGGSSAGPSSTGAGSVGFKDPNNKYPLKSFINEPDTNRLARGITAGTIVPIKDSMRVAGISKALGQGTFEEPVSSFGAKYPYNHVFESESGHVQEFDDTPGHERIHTYHRKGTFTEVDPNGTEVHHIVGDSYTIIDRNGCIYIAGEVNLTVDGNINILSQSTVNLEVTGDANIQVGNNATIGVAKDTNMVVGGNMNLQVDETLNIKAHLINMESATNFNIKSTVSLNETAANINVDATSVLNETASSMNVKAGNYAETVGNSNYRWEGTKHVYTGGDTHERHNGGTDYSNSGDPSRSGSDGASMASQAAVAAMASTADTNLTAPDAGTPLNPVMDFLVSPTPGGEEVFSLESEDDWNTPAGQAAKAALDKKYGVQTPANNPAQDEAKPIGGVNIAEVASCKVIYSTESFTNDFRLSQNFTLGMLIDGGVNGHNPLKDQCGLTKQQIVCNLAQLCTNILEPAVASGLLPGGAAGYGKQWTINSGFRSTSNSANAPTSDHPYGRATDISLLPKDQSRKQRHFDLVQKLEKILPYDQMILEYRSDGSCWIHVGYRGINKGDTSGPGAVNRKMAFTMLNDQVYKRDASGNPSGFILI